MLCRECAELKQAGEFSLLSSCEGLIVSELCCVILKLMVIIGVLSLIFQADSGLFIKSINI